MDSSDNQIDGRDSLVTVLTSFSGPLLIYGAGTAGLEMLTVCQRHDVPVVAFFDDNPALHGKTVGELPVIGRENIQKYYPGAAAIVSIPMLHRARTLLTFMGIENVFAGGFLFSEDEGWGGAHSYCLEKRHRLRRLTYFAHRNMDCHERFCINDVALFITEKCSLRCIHCSQRIPHYDQPQHYDIDALEKTVDNLLQHVDEVGVFSLVGGEPLLYPAWDRIAAKVLASPKVKTLQVITNGTIVPPPEALAVLADERCVVLISEYEGAKQRIPALSEALSANHVYHYAHAYTRGTWTKRPEPELYSRSAEEKERLYLECILRNCFTLASGKLFMCTFALSNANTKTVPVTEEDYVDIDQLAAAGASHKVIQTQIQAYLNRTTPLPICDYCAPQLRGDFSVIPGEQPKS